MSTPLVSIITPSLGPGERLVRCLESVACQTYGHIEHIVVDGGSRDGTVELLRARGIRFVSEPDRGLVDALNKGFGLASGKYIGWLNADDVLLPGAVDRVVGAFSRSPDIGWVYGNCEVRKGDRLVRVIRPPRRLRARSLENGNPLAQPGLMMARWAFDQVGGLDEAFQLAMDYDLWLRLVDAGIRSVYVPETLAVFEIHEGSKTGSIETSEFIREEALALLRTGRRRQAAMAFGRAAAFAALGDGVLIDPRRLRAEIEVFTSIASVQGLAGDVRAVASAACAEAGILELQSSLRGFRHIARPEPWRYPQSARHIAGAAWRGAPHVLRLAAARRAR